MSKADSGLTPIPVVDMHDVHYRVRDRQIFHGLELRVHAGESVAITGPSGSGKSTLLSTVLGLVKPSSGSVRVAGDEVTTLRRGQLAKLRSETVGMVFQSGELLPELSPLDNVALAALLSRTGRTDVYRRAGELLDELGVPHSTSTEELSGGEHQRTAVARALINSPRLVLADEPTGALDPEAADRTAELLFALPQQRACGLLLVTHDMRVATRADRVMTLRDGALVPTQPRAVVA